MKKIVTYIIVSIFLVGCTFPSPIRSDIKEKNIYNSIDDISLNDYIILDMAHHNDKLIILYSANNNIEIPPTKISIVDATNYEKLYEININENSIFGEIITLDNGFYISNQQNIKIYDYQLEVLNEINIDTLQNGRHNIFSEPLITFSQDLSKMAYVNNSNNSLVVRDMNSNEEKLIYKLSEKKGEIMQFDNLYMTTNYIGFSGKYVYSDNIEIAGSNAFGRINIKTKKIDMYEKNETSAKIGNNCLLIVDLMRVDDNDLGTGESIIYHIETNKVERVKLNLSINSFDTEIITPNMIVSYNDIGRNTSKYILYKDGEGRIIDKVIPKTILSAGSCYNENNNSIIVYYTIPAKNDSIKEEIKDVDL